MASSYDDKPASELVAEIRRQAGFVRDLLKPLDSRGFQQLIGELQAVHDARHPEAAANIAESFQFIKDQTAFFLDDKIDYATYNRGISAKIKPVAEAWMAIVEREPRTSPETVEAIQAYMDSKNQTTLKEVWKKLMTDTAKTDKRDMMVELIGAAVLINKRTEQVAARN